jgi:hypothetical protein
VSKKCDTFHIIKKYFGFFVSSLIQEVGGSTRAKSGTNQRRVMGDDWANKTIGGYSGVFVAVFSGKSG